MNLAQARNSAVHEQHVLTNTSLFVRFTYENFFENFEQAMAQLENYDPAAALEEASREMQSFIKDKFENDEDLLTKHAARMRTAGANVVLLKHGLIPALKVDQDNPKLRLLAVETFGYIRAEVEATRNLMM